MPSRKPRPAVVELLDALDGAMRSARWRWYVFGAQAVVAYGRPRMTADVDVAVDLRGASAERCIRVLERRGFRLRMPASTEFLAAAHLLPMLHEASSMPLDVVIVQHELQREFLERSRRLDLGGVRVPVIGKEDLVVTKLLAARRKDLEDVRGVLLERWEELDFARLRALLGELEAAGAGSLVARLDRVSSQARRLLSSPPRSAPAPRPVRRSRRTRSARRRGRRAHRPG
jgi:acetolactate synthase regulatory subunit